jgi:hypothetical protein
MCSNEGAYLGIDEAADMWHSVFNQGAICLGVLMCAMRVSVYVTLRLCRPCPLLGDVI